MLLCGLLNESYKIKSSLIYDKISGLSEKEHQRIYAVIDTSLHFDTFPVVGFVTGAGNTIGSSFWYNPMLRSTM